jgi:hypothetical protein
MTALNLGYMLKSDKPFAIQALGVIVFALLNIRPLLRHHAPRNPCAED